MEKAVGQKLKQIDGTDRSARGYTLDKNGEVTGLALAGIVANSYTFLNDLTSLSFLDLSIHNLKDVSFLKNLNALSSLNLQGNKINSLSFLNDLPNLTSLNLALNPISDTALLKVLPNITSINIGMASLRDTSFLKNFPNLSHLDVMGNMFATAENPALKDYSKVVTTDYLPGL